MKTFRALVATGDGPAQFRQLGDADLPDEPVTVDVTHSSLNYKDGLAVTNKGKIARTFPMVCGIDLTGTVRESSDPAYSPGEEVLVTGWGLSEIHPGGYTERQRVRPEWLTRLPAGFTGQRAMAVGTAGVTAMLCVMALEENGLTPQTAGDVLVTGAAGGVGSIAVAILARLGYRVTASTGRPEAREQLGSFGATGFLDRAELSDASSRPLEKERWSAAIDTVGSSTLSAVLRQTRYRGAVAACGLAGGTDLPITVLPFILRNVALLGIDSVNCPTAVRARAWERLSHELPTEHLDGLTTLEPLSRAGELAELILAGQVRGRVVFDTRA